MDRAALVGSLQQALGSIAPDVADLVWEHTNEASRVHAAVTVSVPVWTATLSAALAQIPDHDRAACLCALRWSDLWLSTALAQGDTAALELFEASLMPEIDRALRRLSLATDDREEIEQHIRIRLLVPGASGLPKIAQYSGNGSLGAWLRTVSTRMALNHGRYLRDHENLDDVPESALQEAPEFSQLRQEHRAVFLDALKQAFRRLDRRSRTLLRLRYSGEMTATALARAYTVHESTMSRWLADARKAMAGNFEAVVTEGLGDAAAVADLLGVLEGSLDFSLTSLFNTSPRAET